MQAVLLDQATFCSSLSWSDVEAQVDTLRMYPTTDAEQLIEHVGDAQIILTNKVRLGAKELKQLPQVKLICIAATGMNNIDLVAAKSLAIKVTNVVGYSTVSVAQQVMCFILNFATQQSVYTQEVRKGFWQKSSVFCLQRYPIFLLADKSLGIIGYGAIGQAVEKLAQAFGMQIFIAQYSDSKKIDHLRVPLEDCLSKSDFVSLHCPLTAQTEKFMNAQRLAQMRPDAYLINTARGGLIDEPALAYALQSEQLAGAGLDVLTQEPPKEDNVLLKMKHPQLMITPHIAWASQESQRCLVGKIALQIAAWKQPNV